MVGFSLTSSVKKGITQLLPWLLLRSNAAAGLSEIWQCFPLLNIWLHSIIANLQKSTRLISISSTFVESHLVMFYCLRLSSQQHTINSHLIDQPVVDWLDEKPTAQAQLPLNSASLQCNVLLCATLCGGPQVWLNTQQWFSTSLAARCSFH